MTNSLDVMNRHLGKVEEIELEDKEKVLIAPLTADYMPDFLMIQLKLENKQLDKELLSYLQNCVYASLRLGNPREVGMAEDVYEKTIKDFGSRYFGLITSKMFEINQGGMQQIDADKANKIKQKISNART